MQPLFVAAMAPARGYILTLLVIAANAQLSLKPFDLGGDVKGDVGSGSDLRVSYLSAPIEHSASSA